MKIRNVKKEDKEQILKLARLLYRGSQKIVQKYEKRYYTMCEKAFVVEDKRKLIGYIAFNLRRDSLYIADLYIKKDYRRRGIATSLLKIVGRMHKKFKKKYLRVDVRKKDYPARKLYEKFGFKFWKPKGKRSIKLKK
ncbi:MAG: GNAT family N-acetyltransferase [Candidatus Pacearchaeota archaeon]